MPKIGSNLEESNDHFCLCSDGNTKPKTYQTALKFPHWKGSMEEEMGTLIYLFYFFPFE